MEKQERRPESRKESHAKEEVKPNPKVVESGKKMKEDIDKLVDEIDDVLEKKRRRICEELCAKGRGIVPSLFDLVLTRSPIAILDSLPLTIALPHHRTVRL